MAATENFEIRFTVLIDKLCEIVTASYLTFVAMETLSQGMTKRSPRAFNNVHKEEGFCSIIPLVQWLSPKIVYVLFKNNMPVLIFSIQSFLEMSV